MSAALSSTDLLFTLLGVGIGLLAGGLPGVGAVAAIALLVPAAAGLDAAPALIMLAAVAYGARAGGLRSAATVVAASSFVAGGLATGVIAMLAAPVARLAFQFGPAEYFSLLLLGLVGAVVLAAGSIAKGLATAVLGLLLAQIGGSGDAAGRFTFGIAPLAGGVGFALVALAVFVVAAVVARLEAPIAPRETGEATGSAAWPTRAELSAAWPLLRGTMLGSAFGLLPGGGAQLAAFVSAAMQKRFAANAHGGFGSGSRSAVAAESARGAGVHASFLPLLAFGIPANAALALLTGAMMLDGIAPGPQVMTSRPELFWGLIASMWVGNLVLLLLHLPLRRLRARLPAVPYRFVFPMLVVLCCIGAAASGRGAFALYPLALLAILGHVLHKLDCAPTPLLLGFVLAPLLEDNARRALLLSAGEWSTFVTRPLSSGLLIAAVLLVAVVSLPSIRGQRDLAFND